MSKNNGGVTTRKKDYIDMLNTWLLCRDSVEGQKRIKEQGEIYLPRLTGHSQSDYKRYLDQALYVNNTKRTKEAYVGQIFKKEPQEQLPKEYDTFLKNPTRDNSTFNHVVNTIVSELIEVNRIGILIDHPNVDTSKLSQKEVEDLKINPYWTLYKAESITNWRVKKSPIGSEDILQLVVLIEFVSKVLPDDPFVNIVVPQYRVLTLDDKGEYVQQIWELKKLKQAKMSVENQEFVLKEEIKPLANGKPLRQIPFYILTERGVNYKKVFQPIIYDLAVVNVAHYRNSADHEWDLHRMAAKTIIGTGVKRNQTMSLGGFVAIEAKDASVNFLEGKETTALNNALKEKSMMMAILGSQALAQKGRFVEAAETARIQQDGEISILQALSIFTSQSIETILKDTANWFNISEDRKKKIQTGDEVEYKLNTDFDSSKIPAQDIMSLIDAWKSKVISLQVLRWNLRKGERIPADKLDEDMDKEIEENPPTSDNPFDIIDPSLNSGDNEEEEEEEED